MGMLPLGWWILKPYQRDRLLAFIDPHADPLGAGYTVIQSQIAMGSGQWLGRGWFAGTQNQLNFLPERHSDFIFSVIGEEWGFLGCLVVMGAFGLLLLRILEAASRTVTPHAHLFTVGVYSWLAYQAFVNMGMVMGVVPVVGIPLPFLSYGGSSMVAVWVAVGRIQWIQVAERKPP
jgi:rod shape determining protein RodA